jgi:hypothetical protein
VRPLSATKDFPGLGSVCNSHDRAGLIPCCPLLATLAAECRGLVGAALVKMFDGSA